ncbi:MAG: putative drug exporter of the superfamily, partial [Streptomyces sp.]|nr:putative drug exporter of the superfamily [Streptomyces sp.]
MGAPSSTTVAAAAPGQRKRRRWRAVPWAVLVLWLAVVALAGPLAGKLADVQQNRAVDYLPVSADSTQVAKVQEALPGGEATDLVVVYHRDGGLTAADRSRAGAQTAEIARAHELTRQPTGVPSKDGTTLMYAVSSTQPGQDDAARNAFVDDVRKVADGGDGLTAEVGGAGALNTDMKEVYSSLDGPLLYTTVAVVAVLLILIYRSP